MPPRTRQARNPNPTPKIDIFVDGVPVVKIGKARPAPLTDFLAVARLQLNTEKRPTFHFPDMPTRIARSILSFTQDSRALKTLSFAQASFCVPDRLVANLETYFRLLQVGMKPQMVLSMAFETCSNFASTWRDLTPGDIRGLDEVFKCCETALRWNISSFLKDPVFTMIAHTLAYGRQEHQFAQGGVIEHALQQDGVLERAVDQVGPVPYAIRGLVAAPTEYPLPRRRRVSSKQNFLENPVEANDNMGLEDYRSTHVSPASQSQQRASPTLSSAASVLSDIFPFRRYPEPSPPSWSPPTSITASGLHRLGLDMYIRAEIPDENDEDHAFRDATPEDTTDRGALDSDDESGIEWENVLPDDASEPEQYIGDIEIVWPDAPSEAGQQADDVKMTDANQQIATPPFTPANSQQQENAVYRSDSMRQSTSPPNSYASSNASSIVAEDVAPISPELSIHSRADHTPENHEESPQQQVRSSYPPFPFRDPQFPTNPVSSVSGVSSRTPPWPTPAALLRQPRVPENPQDLVSGFGTELDDYARRSGIIFGDITIPFGLETELRHARIKAFLEGHKRARERQAHLASLVQERRVQDEIRRSMGGNGFGSLPRRH